MRGWEGRGRTTRAALAAVMGLIGITGAVVSSAVRGQEYPARPVRIVVPYAAGIGTDVAVRLMAEAMNKSIPPGVSGRYVVENRPGASGNIGSAHVATQKPDGYALLLGSNATHAANLALYPDLPFDPVKSFDAIFLYYAGGMVLVTTPSSTLRDFKTFVAQARQKPGSLDVATPSMSARAALEVIRNGAAIEVTNVPYQSNVPALADVTSGRVPLLMDTITSLIARINRGELRPLAVSFDRRSALLPEVPTFEEVGAGGISITSWTAYFSPKGTPPEIIASLNAAMNKAMGAREVQDFIANTAARPLGGTPADAGAFVQAEIRKWGDIIRKAGIKAD